VGAPVWQPVRDIVKLLHKQDVLSDRAWLFRFCAAICAVLAIYAAATIPWIYCKPQFGTSDLFLAFYLFAGMRLFTLLAAMDTGSAFGAFAASRESTLSFMAEPAAVLALTALAIGARSSDLCVIFSASHPLPPLLWACSGCAFLLASIVELSRMPIDDPSTHLELTMIHEAMVLEASGKSLALFEFANSLKLAVLFGLSSQCFLNAVLSRVGLNQFAYGMASLGALVFTTVIIGILESLCVKLHWRKAPEFIAYALVLSLVSATIALGGIPN
jgi:formate hydrogenlyase subunit 4